MINRVVLVGRLTRDPEPRKTDSGKSIASFTIAVDNTTKNPDGSRGTLYLNCTAWNQSADTIVKYTRKGSLVGVDGRLNQRDFTRKDGSKGSAVEVIVDSVSLLGPKADTQEGEANNDIQDTSFEDNGTNLEGLDLPDDDLPF